MSDMHDDIPVKDMPEAHRTKSLVMDKDHRTLRRDEFEDRIHQLTDENVFLKKHSRKFEEKAKQLETKLNRILSEKKFLGRKDEIDVEESKHRIIELEYQVGMLKDKLQVAKQQLVSYTRMFPVPSNKQIKSKSNKVPTSNSSSAGLAPNSELSEQFEILLLEIKTENQALGGQVKQLRDQIRSLQREVDTSKELLQIKEIAHEDEINILRAQLGDPDQAKKKLAENIQLIRLQRDSRRASSWLSTLETQCKALESSLSSAQETNQQLESQLNSSQEELQQCQQQNLDLQKQVEDHRAEISRVKELEAQINSLQEENTILKEVNDSLQGKVISAGEKVRKVESEEATLKSHISQMEITLKKEIQSKSDLYSEVSREKTKCQTLTETLTELQKKFSEMEIELKRLEKTSESLSVPLVTYLEPGRHSPTVVVSSESQVYEDKSSTSTIIIERAAEPRQGVREEVISSEPSKPKPPVPVEIPLKDSTITAEVNGNRPLSQCEYCRTLEKDLTNTRTNMDKLHDDLIKTKNLLKSQMNTNRECHKEIEVLSVKLEKADKFHHEKLQEFMQVLEERATQMQNLEKNLESIKSQTRIIAPTSDAEIQVTPRTPPEDDSTNKESSTPAPAIPSVEIFIDKFVPVESQKHLVNESLFATWEYNEDGTHYSPVVRNGNFSSGSLHSFDEGSFQNPIQVQIHQAIGSSDCQTLGKGILSPEQNSCTITSVISPEEPLGELKYKFLIKGADMKNVTAVRVEMAQKPKLDSPKKTEPSSSSNTNEDTPKKLPVPKPRTLSTQPEINISTSSQTEASDNENPIKIKRSKKKRFGEALIPKPLDRILDEEQVVHSPKRPILRKKSESPEVRKQPKKVTVAEIVEERQIPTTEDEKSVSSEGTYEIKRPLPENFSEVSGDGSDLSLAKRLAAEAGYEIPVIQVQSSGPPDPPKSGPPPQDSTTEVSISSNSGDETPAPAVSSDTSRKRKSKKKTRSPLGSEDSFDSTETSSLDSNSYKQSIRIEISYIVFNSPCRIWSDTKVKKIFVEYRFLDFDPEELETPSSVPKPQPGKKAEFNFIKVFIIDNKERRRLLQGMLREKKRIRFTIVSEPGENDTLDCEDIGYAYVPVTTLANEDLDHELIKIYDAENPRLEMGSLCVSIQARQVLKSL
ncbi:unnamed protein product [Allacma fusca]|uniref:RPGRIP1 C-terminal domain-containing protein n=1 Tax=Allacma fusca TaxID=39272 RepID=A0A8J2JVA6_9HEXA|nr:unnamed protein product [Allacma fusca]